MRGELSFEETERKSIKPVDKLTPSELIYGQRERGTEILSESVTQVKNQTKSDHSWDTAAGPAGAKSSSLTKVSSVTGLMLHPLKPKTRHRFLENQGAGTTETKMMRMMMKKNCPAENKI